MSGHYELKKAKNGQYHFNFKSPSGEILITSEMYASETSAENAIKLMRKYINDESSFELKTAKDQLSYFVLKTPGGRVLGVSEMYTSEHAANETIQKLISANAESLINYDSNNKTPERALRVGSIMTFLKCLQELKKENTHAFYYRGHQDITYDLLPGIYRKKYWIENEHKLFRELMLKCPLDFQASSIGFQKLVKMQHYALPTRLLDITTNPLIALFFASEERFEHDLDGEVIVFRIPKKEIKYYDDSSVSLLSNISKQSVTTDNQRREMSIDSFNNLIHDVKVEGCYINDDVEIKSLNKVLCVKPQMDNPRIIKQDGAFLLFGIDRSKNEPAKIPDDYMMEEKIAIIIAKESKSKIREQLETFGISPSTVYPEIEHVANHIKSSFNF